MASLRVPAAWYRKGVDAIALWQSRQGRPPTPEEYALLAEQVRQIQGGMARHEELTFEHHHFVLDFLTKHGRMPTGYPSNDHGENQGLVRQAMARHDAHVQAYDAAHPSFWSHLSPAHLIAAAGNVVSAAAPFVEMAVSMVPVAGQLYSAAKTAVNIGTALAKGRPLTDAFIDSALGFLPGGAVAQRAARAVMAIAKGRSLTGELLDQVKEQFPGADHAIAVAAGIAHGRNLQELAVNEVKNMAADQIHALALPIPPGVEVPANLQHGFRVAMGVLESPTLTPAAALALRARLGPLEQQGFDRAMQMRVLKHARAGSPHVPPVLPELRGTTLVTHEGPVQL